MFDFDDLIMKWTSSSRPSENKITNYSGPRSFWSLKWKQTLDEPQKATYSTESKLHAKCKCLFFFAISTHGHIICYLPFKIQDGDIEMKEAPKT